MNTPNSRAATAPRRRLRVALSTTVAVVALGGLVAGAASSASAAVSPTYVAQSDIGTSYAADGQITWLSDLGGGGTSSVTTDAFDGGPAIKMVQTGASSQVNIFRSYGVGVRPTSVSDVLAGSSFSYAGSSVNFQLAMFYTPADPITYGPGTGPTNCAQAKDNGVDRPGMCFVTIKYDPHADSNGSYSTITLADKQDPFFDGNVSQPGWWDTQRVGQYTANQRNVTLDQLLGQMSSYEIYAIGASVGTHGAAGDVSWVKNLTFGGASYNFGDAPVTPPTTPPAPPAAAPAASDDALEQLIATQGIDVAATTDTFSVGGGAPGTGLDALDPSKPISGELPWTGQGDSYVDVYGYSSPIYLGTFPVVNGKVVLTGLDISALEAGGHHLVFLGQTSGALSVVAIAVDTLASTGANPMPYLVIGGVLLLLGIIALGIVTVRRRTRRARH
jgi:hypothetical protein